MFHCEFLHVDSACVHTFMLQYVREAGMHVSSQVCSFTHVCSVRLKHFSVPGASCVGTGQGNVELEDV